MKKLLLFFIVSNLYAQQNSNIDSSFLNYTDKKREVIYTHINKSTYIKNEEVGFTSYIFLKNTKKPSSLSSNLYCAILNKKNEIIKQKLFKIKNGVSKGSFTLDSTFTSGEYIFKAYTNWMNNFKEQNFFIQTIKVIDPQIQQSITNKEVSPSFDAQLLPEGGHLIYNTNNTIGVSVKNASGFGVSNILGELINDTSGEVLDTFKLNSMGIGKFSLFLRKNINYKVRFTYNNIVFFSYFKDIKEKGIAFSLIKKRKGVLINLETNNDTHHLIKEKPFLITIHNGEKLKKINVKFKDSLHIKKLIPNKLLFSGINILTLFDEKNNPILERLFFNYDGLKFLKSKNVFTEKINDSLKINLNYNKLYNDSINNISISVLTQKTKSYNHHHNIASYLHLQPYINNYIENGKDYFSNINTIKKKNLDNFLLTHGWSSYQWNDIFNYKTSDDIFYIEDGISVNITLNKKSSDQYIVDNIGKKSKKIFQLDKGNKKFNFNSLFPTKNEKLKIGQINKKGKIFPLKAYLQFQPSSIPKLNIKKSNYLNLKPEYTYISENEKNSIYKSFSEDFENLNEVEIKGLLKNKKIEKLKRRTNISGLHVFTDADRNNGVKFFDYLRAKGYYINDRPIIGRQEDLQIKKAGHTTVNLKAIPIFYLDGVKIDDAALGELLQIDMRTVEAIHVNKLGLGHGARGGSGGVIKIFTNRNLLNSKSNTENVFSKYPFPLTFSVSKRHYVPKYKNYKNYFYNSYGVVDWIPINKVKSNGAYSFKVKKHTKNITLFIEGVTNKGKLISEIITVE